MDESCNVTGCKNDKFKTVSRKEAEKIFSLSSNYNKVHLCKEHYKEFKKKTKKDREIERLTWVK